MKTAILIDGGFYRRRAQALFGEKDARSRAEELSHYCHRHLKEKHEDRELYRIFYYDCPPMEKKIYHPLLKAQIDYSTTELYTWTHEFFKELKKRRKFALRLGNLSESVAHFNLRMDATKKLCAGSLRFEDITDEHFELKVEQKGVDMKIGIDIASMAYKKQVEQIILIAGDSDFVPAAKLARREGIDFILDPMGNTIKPDLQEHIDGIRSQTKHFVKKQQVRD